MIAVSLRPANAGFQSTLPTRGSDYRGKAASILNDPISIHAPHEGERLLKNMQQHNYKPFQSTLPTRGSDIKAFIHSLIGDDISIHAPHEGERHDGYCSFTNSNVISIHAPHEGERHISSLSLFISHLISIHAPHEGERRSSSIFSIIFFRFQSTLPTRGSDQEL